MFKCDYCTSEFKDELSHRTHQYKCMPTSQTDPYIRAWLNDTNKSGFYRDDPYY